METQEVVMKSEEGKEIVVRVPSGFYQLEDGSWTCNTCYGRRVTEEVREEMSKALAKATEGKPYGWKSSFRVRLKDLNEAKVLVEAVEFFHATDAKFEESCDGLAYIVASRGYSA